MKAMFGMALGFCLMLAALPAMAQTSTISDTLTVAVGIEVVSYSTFDDPHRCTDTPTLVVSDFLANSSLFGTPLAWKDSNGGLSDVFGVVNAGLLDSSPTPIYKLGFISDPLKITKLQAQLFGFADAKAFYTYIVANVVTEPTGAQDVTNFLSSSVTGLGGTATFVSLKQEGITKGQHPCPEIILRSKYDRPSGD